MIVSVKGLHIYEVVTINDWLNIAMVMEQSVESMTPTLRSTAYSSMLPGPIWNFFSSIKDRSTDTSGRLSCRLWMTNVCVLVLLFATLIWLTLLTFVNTISQEPDAREFLLALADCHVHDTSPSIPSGECERLCVTAKLMLDLQKGINTTLIS